MPSGVEVTYKAYLFIETNAGTNFFPLGRSLGSMKRVHPLSVTNLLGKADTNAKVTLNTDMSSNLM